METPTPSTTAAPVTGRSAPEPVGVSVTLFSRAVRMLVRLYGDRAGSPAQLERLRAALAEVEAAWLAMPKPREKST